MAIKTGMEDLNPRGASENDVNITGADETFSGKPESKKSDIEVLGLTTMDMMTFDTNSFSEYLTEYIGLSKEVLKDSKIKINMFKLDRDKFGLPFSYVIYASKASNNTIYYFVSVLEKTGREPVDLNLIIEDSGNKNSSTSLVTADSFSDERYKIFEDILIVNYGKMPLVALESIVVPSRSNLEIAADTVTRLAHDVILSNIRKDVGAAIDINFSAISGMLRKGMLNVDLSYTRGETVNKVGKPVFTEFSIESSIVNNAVLRDFDTAGRKRIAMATGYIDYFFIEETNTYTGQLKKSAEPLFILNEFIGSAPTINFVLISIVNAYIFNNYQNLRGLIIETDAGPLNYYLNFNGDVKKVGERVSFKDPKITPEILNAMVDTCFLHTPVFNIEIELSGTDYSYASPFTALADGNAAQQANNDILKAASLLTDANITNINVAYNEGLAVPIGEFTDKDGNVRDLREINAVFIAANTKDPSLLIDWAYSNLPTSECIFNTRKDPYMLKLEVLNKLATQIGITPKITGKAFRIPLNPAFIEALVIGAKNKGYQPKIITPNIHTTDYVNLANMASVYSGAHVSNMGFGNSDRGYVHNVNSYSPARYR